MPISCTANETITSHFMPRKKVVTGVVKLFFDLAPV